MIIKRMNAMRRIRCAGSDWLYASDLGNSAIGVLQIQGLTGKRQIDVIQAILSAYSDGSINKWNNCGRKIRGCLVRWAEDRKHFTQSWGTLPVGFTSELILNRLRLAIDKRCKCGLEAPDDPDDPDDPSCPACKIWNEVVDPGP